MRWKRRGDLVAVLLAASLGMACSSPDDPTGADTKVAEGSPGAGCSTPTQCGSGICVQERCVSPRGDDGVRNADETDVDCGGADPKLARCASDRSCRGASDCASLVCKGFVCRAPSPSDQVKNGTETDVDCGGPTSASRCKSGLACGASSDCDSKLCKDGRCLSATAVDGIKNGLESDVDCGGAGAGTPRCADLRACSESTDCQSAVCTPATGSCAAPTATDGVKNGDESDADCGGTTTRAARCGTDKQCAKDDDCNSRGCGANKRCAIARSCTGTSGAVTCGAGEVGTSSAVHESCCTPARALSTGVVPDKYQITAGRMRAFVERVGGNVVRWLGDARASLPAATQATVPVWMDAYLPTGFEGAYGVWNQLGSSVYLRNRPSTQQGCFIDGTGTHTYWMSAGVQRTYFGDGAHGFSQDELDAKALNCVTEPMLAAFCAWDGGRLETAAEQAEMYGPAMYPWGASPDPAGFGPVNGVYQRVSGRPGASGGACPGCQLMTNWLGVYRYPAPNASRPTDFSYFIAAPGRFPRDIGPNGTLDTAGNLIEATSTFDGTDPENGQPRVVWSKNGSWEGHPIGGSPSYKFALLTKYGKMGGRCVR